MTMSTLFRNFLGICGKNFPTPVQRAQNVAKHASVFLAVTANKGNFRNLKRRIFTEIFTENLQKPFNGSFNPGKRGTSVLSFNSFLDKYIMRTT